MGRRRKIILQGRRKSGTNRIKDMQREAIWEDVPRWPGTYEMICKQIQETQSLNLSAPTLFDAFIF
jgi:hypothetical protein